MFYKNNDSLETMQKEFQHFYNLGPHSDIPSKPAIKGWNNKFEETGSALKKKPAGRPRRLVLHGLLMLYASPQRPTRKQAAAEFFI
ncbi:Helix-turn-helix domain (DUF4817) [Popillia japonica]|uniref:Helix-turn-helix domain (DUF4817) n=1 Tax=Popillia japonica TaxID=7064 RepID=A0AAW1JX67_POPJA